MKEMMDKEGVILDFSDTKIRGKIVTKTTIIKEISDKDGYSQFTEDEVIDEKHFGSDLDSLSSKSFSQYEEKVRTDPIFTMGSPVLSSTFNRQKQETENLQRREIKIVTEQQEPTSYSHFSETLQYDDDSSSSDSGETIEVVQIPEQHSQASVNLTHLDSTVVVLGTEPNVSHIYSFLKQKNVRKAICSSVSGLDEVISYTNLATELAPGENVVFVWAVETKTGELSEDLVFMFRDFIEVFSPNSITSMIVVLWHPGSTEDIRSSVEDLTKKFEQSMEYHSTIGFAVMHFKPIPRFYEALADKLVALKPMRFDAGYFQVETEVSIAPEEERNETPLETVDSPVLLLVSPPGHGKSSVGNLLLGAGHFQVRGTAVGGDQTLQVNTGWLFEDECRVTCIESPGLYEDGVDVNGVTEMEQHLRSIGFITHLILVWDALEWRTEDLDFVLGCVKNIFGERIVSHLVFVVTFWDPDQKSRKERSKRKISATSIDNMIAAKVQHFFGSRSDPVVFLVSAKSANDRSRIDIANFLCSSSWPIFRVNIMKPWIHEINLSPVPAVDSNPAPGLEEVDVGMDRENSDSDSHDYEDVGRISHRSTMDNKSKSLHNLALADTPGKQEQGFGGNKKFGGSLFGLQQGSKSTPRKPRGQVGRQNAQPRGRTPSPFGGFGGGARRGRGRGTNLERKRSMSQGNIFSMGRGRGKRPVMQHQKSVDNLYVEEEDRSPEQRGLSPASRSDDFDSIIMDSNYQDPGTLERQVSGERPGARGRARRRVKSGSSFTLNLRGSSKDRRRGSRTSLDRSKTTSTRDISVDRRDSSMNRRRTLSLTKKPSPRVNQPTGDKKTPVPAPRRGSRSSQNRSRNTSRNNLSNQENQTPNLQGRRGRSRSRGNLTTNQRSQSSRSVRAGSRPPPGECIIL